MQKMIEMSRNHHREVVFEETIGIVLLHPPEWKKSYQQIFNQGKSLDALGYLLVIDWNVYF